ncbi:hypothetical protein [Azospirillum sp.]|uniref:hypothetical protein n=1 Tax=Azospirillum sp. TaxID=34012 RepID=UPI003D706E03
MTTMQHRLLGRLHRVFDRAPGDFPALRVRAPGGLRWTVADDVLTVFRPALPDLEVPLEGKTIRAVRDELAAAGCQIVHADGEALDTSALALLEGEGDQDWSNGDHLRAYSTLLWGWTDAVGRVLTRAKTDIEEMLRQLVIRQSEGEWTDLWGSYFGIIRRAEESDAALAERIIWEPRRPRSNPVAMRANIKRLTGAAVQSREPWREMMVLGRSRLGGTDRLPDGREFCYHTLQFVSPEFQDWDAVMREAELDRPAGTLLIPPVTLPPPYPVVINAGTGVGFAGEDVYSWRVKDYDGHILGYNFYPSGTFRRRNPQFAIFDAWSGSGGELAPPPDIGARRTYCRGEIVLSEQAPLGSQQAHLPGRMRRERGAPMRLSHSGRLSDYEWALDWLPILEWVTERVPFVPNDAPEYPPQDAISPEEWHFGAAGPLPTDAPMGVVHIDYLETPQVYGNSWTGGWDSRRWGHVAYPDPVVTMAYETLP